MLRFLRSLFAKKTAKPIPTFDAAANDAFKREFRRAYAEYAKRT
jgi:hypothetical protein